MAQVAPAAAQGPTPAQAARYPLDPVCPWGRLADGHGLLVRCLERGEAQGLLAGAGAPAPVAPQFVPVPAAPPAAPAPAPRGAAQAPAAPPAAVPPALAAAAGPTMPPAYLPPAYSPPAYLPPAPPATAAAAAAPGTAPAPANAAPAAAPPLAAAVPLAPPGVAPPAPRSTKIYRKVSVREVGAALADTGELPEAQIQLRKVTDRYAQCVSSNGGLEGTEGRVTVRFLVRERGRAEGVAVKDRQGVSLAAAKCVAEVVDRRFVGYPAAPIVGASLSIDFVPEGGAR